MGLVTRSMLRNCDVGACVYTLDATPWLGWGWGGMIRFFAMVDATQL